jgi:hypothetical protein
MALPIIAGAAIGVYNTRMDFVCSYAGDGNSLLVSLSEMYHTRPDLAAPIFSHDLNLNGGEAAIHLIVGVGIALAMLFMGIVVAQRRPGAEPVRSE